jgi:hypothetical protein
MYTCPVCGFEELVDPPTEFSICPCCGTEFELDDAFATHAELRSVWLRNGAHWWSPVVDRPVGWDPYNQINNLIEQTPLSSVLRTAVLRLFQSFVERDDFVQQQVQCQSRQPRAKTSLPSQLSRPARGTSNPLEFANPDRPFQFERRPVLGAQEAA